MLVNSLKLAFLVGALPNFTFMCLNMHRQFPFSEVGALTTHNMTAVIWNGVVLDHVRIKLTSKHESNFAQ